jgi:RNA polymerase sigma-54 factor
LLQLERKLRDGKSVKQAIEILTYYFDEFTKKHYDKIQRGLGIDDEGLKEVIQQIVKLTPKPGGNIGQSSNGQGLCNSRLFYT